MEDKCNCSLINPQAVFNAQNKMPDENSLTRLSRIFDSFGDITRIKIISALSEGELCVCDIAVLLSMSHSAVSHQLRILRQTDIVAAKKVGKAVYYRLADKHIADIYKVGLSHIFHLKEDETL